MSETILAIGITATCANGLVHDNVVMKNVDGVVIYETSDGEHLCGDCCVESLDSVSFIAPLPYIAQAVHQYRKQEAR